MEELIKPLAILTSSAIFLILVLLIWEGLRLARLEKKIDMIAKHSNEFIRFGLSHFKNQKNKKK
jgi:hypothetical protein